MVLAQVLASNLSLRGVEFSPVATAAMPSLKDLEPIIREVCTERQRHTLALVGAGYSIRQAADVLDLDVATVRQHLRAALRNVRRALEIAA